MEKCATCGDQKFVVINPGRCGGCEVCGSTEEEIVPCPDCGELETN